MLSDWVRECRFKGPGRGIALWWWDLSMYVSSSSLNIFTTNICSYII